jgi:hypothetical protein
MALRILCIRRTFPGLPLEQLMPPWIPAHLLIGYLTGASLVVAGVYILLDKARIAATYLGMDCAAGRVRLWSDSDRGAVRPTDVKDEGINYFFDTMLFAGAILALASATPRTD